MKALLSAVLVAALATVSHARLDNEITQWQVAAQQTVAALAVPNQMAARLYGAVGIAQYEGIKSLPKGASQSVQAAVAAYAGHQVLSGFYPFRQSPFYDGILARQISALRLSRSSDRAAYSAGISSARKVLRERYADGIDVWANFIPAPPNVTASIGRYQWTPGQTDTRYPQLAHTTPFALKPSQVAQISAKFRAHNLKSAAYKAELNQVLAVGVANSTVRSKYDTDSARFWSLGSGTSAIAGVFLNVSYDHLPETISYENLAKFYAVFGGATFDAGVVCWRVKFRELFWRPVTAIRQGDGVNAPVPTWTPQLSTPQHPEYPSGHQCTAGAAAAVLRAFLKKDTFSFTVRSEGAPDLERTYPSLTAVTTESGFSRLYAGVHFQKANVDGTILGEDVAKAVLKSFH